ncbi:MAG: C-GCAxxG-C-C family protein, partial [Lachnospiraceae bacterium]|nr:C-GCAxxG-C-C family protein [Lachnospiraceae bacterium]
MNRKELAIELHKKKFNCCQSVVCAFSGTVDVDEKTLFQAGEAFGLGMGCMECTCGALSGAMLLAGFKNSDGNTDSPATKAETYKLAKEMVRRFRERAGSCVCRELKGIETGKLLCSCPDCIRYGVE